MTELTDRQILDAMRKALEETARKFAQGELDLTGAFSVAGRPVHQHSNAKNNAAHEPSSQMKKDNPRG
ncbi:MAG TPA: hypothetical protein VHY79_01965 [Rhizomicrobium sp.]|nr:hypothetical protein [Rhizomicrobium sp.]